MILAQGTRKRTIRGVIFVSFDSTDRNIGDAVVRSLRSANEGTPFFWTGDSLPSGEDWFGNVKTALEDAAGVICLITNDQTGTNNWINFEVGAAVGGRKHLIIIIAAGVSAPQQLSAPLQHLQFIAWADRVALAAALKRSGLSHSDAAVETLVGALEPPALLSCRYGLGREWHQFSNWERSRLEIALENRKEIVVSNELIDGPDPVPCERKLLEVEVRPPV